MGIDVDYYVIDGREIEWDHDRANDPNILMSQMDGVMYEYHQIYASGCDNCGDDDIQKIDLEEIKYELLFVRTWN